MIDLDNLKPGDRIRYVEVYGSGAGYTVGKVYTVLPGGRVVDDDGENRPIPYSACELVASPSGGLWVRTSDRLPEHWPVATQETGDAPWYIADAINYLDQHWLDSRTLDLDAIPPLDDDHIAPAPEPPRPEPLHAVGDLVWRMNHGATTITSGPVWNGLGDCWSYPFGGDTFVNERCLAGPLPVIPEDWEHTGEERAPKRGESYAVFGTVRTATFDLTDEAWIVRRALPSPWQRTLDGIDSDEVFCAYSNGEVAIWSRDEVDDEHRAIAFAPVDPANPYAPAHPLREVEG